jgi:pseudouridine 5'-phosphatase
VEKWLKTRKEKQSTRGIKKAVVNSERLGVGKTGNEQRCSKHKRHIIHKEKVLMERRTIQGVAFDMDGLMLNTEDLYVGVGNTLMARRGKKYRDEVRNQMIGLQAEHAFGVLIREEELKETWRELQQEAEEIFSTILAEQLTVMNGLVELMDFLDARGLPRCVATSSNRSFATKALSLVGMLDRVDFVLTAEDVERGKPHPDIYLASALKMSLPIQHMLVLEDSPTGTKAGVSAGAYVVSVPNEHTKRFGFEGSQWIADTLRDSRLYALLSEQ